MLITKHTIETTTSPVAIWEVWQDVTNWNTWDHGVEYSTLDGPFVCEAKLPFALIKTSHFLTEANGKTEVTHQIEMNGPLAFFFAFVIGRNMKKNLPQEMMAMIKKASTHPCATT